MEYIAGSELDFSRRPSDANPQRRGFKAMESIAEIESDRPVGR
jgi:hypothetical protein